MKKKNGFISTAVIYSFFFVFLMVLLYTVNTYTSNRRMLNVVKDDIKEDLKREITKRKVTINVLGGYVNGGNTLANLVVNGSYENGNTGWNLSNAVVVTTQHSDGNYALQFNNGTLTAMSSQATIQPILNHIYYGRLKFLSTPTFSASDNRFEYYFTDAVNIGNMIFARKDTRSTEWTLLSSIQTITDARYLANNWIFRNFLVNPTTLSYTDELMVIDLTNAYGAGNEPTKEYLDQNLFYFDGLLSQRIDKVDNATSATYTITPSGGHTLVGARVSGEGCLLTGSTLALNNISKDVICTVTLP